MKDSKTRMGTVIVLIIALVFAFIIFGQKPSMEKNIKNSNKDSVGIIHLGWETQTGTNNKFMYPVDLGTKFITPNDWPPTLSTNDTKYSCIESGSEISSEGKTSKININGSEYCLTKQNEGAAGSTYTTYTYTRPFGETEESLTFSLRFVQCDNYDEPQKSDCKKERALFDIDSVIGDIFNTIVRQ